MIEYGRGEEMTTNAKGDQMPDGLKRKRRRFSNGMLDKARIEWYALHRQRRFTKRFGWL